MHRKARLLSLTLVVVVLAHGTRVAAEARSEDYPLEARRLFLEAEKLFDRGEYRDAIDRYEAAARAGMKDHPRVEARIIECHNRRGDPKGIVLKATRIIERNRVYVFCHTCLRDAYASRAAAYVRLQDFGAAGRDYLALIKLSEMKLKDVADGDNAGRKAALADAIAAHHDMAAFQQVRGDDALTRKHRDRAEALQMDLTTLVDKERAPKPSPLATRPKTGRVVVESQIAYDVEIVLNGIRYRLDKRQVLTLPFPAGDVSYFLRTLDGRVGEPATGTLSAGGELRLRVHH